MEAGPRTAKILFKPGGYRNLKRILGHNFNYIGNLLALWQWYDNIRSLFIGPQYPELLAAGLKKTLQRGIDERIRQLGRLKGKIEDTLPGDTTAGIEARFCNQWDNIADMLTDLQDYQGTSQLKDQFQEIVDQVIQIHGKMYTQCIKGLTADQSGIGTQWLQSILDHVTEQVASIINPKK